MTKNYTVRNGDRVEVILPNFVGKAGVQDWQGKRWLAYVPNQRGSVAIGAIVMIGDQPYQILSDQPGSAPRMRLLEIEPFGA